MRPKSSLAGGQQDLPLGTTESEAVGKLASHSIPVLGLLLLRKLEKGIVEGLEVLVLLDQRRIVPPGAAASTTTTSSSATAWVTTASLALDGC